MCHLTWSDLTVILIGLERYEKQLDEQWRAAVGIDRDVAGSTACQLNDLRYVRTKVRILRKQIDLANAEV